MKIECFECNAAIAADDADGVVEQFLAHARERHEWSYPEEALRNYARNYAEVPERPWRQTRSRMIERLRTGSTFGYLAYVEGRAAGWVNASTRAHYSPVFRRLKTEGPDPSSVIGVSCFVVAPPFRRHRIASRLLDRVIADAAARGAAWVEGYPLNAPRGPECQHFFRGPRSLYEARGFEALELRERDTVMRRPA